MKANETSKAQLMSKKSVFTSFTAQIPSPSNQTSEYVRSRQARVSLENQQILGFTERMSKRQRMNSLQQSTKENWHRGKVTYGANTKR